MRVVKQVRGSPIDNRRVNGCQVLVFNEGKHYRAVVYGPNFRGGMSLLYTCRGELPGATADRAIDMALNMVTRG